MLGTHLHKSTFNKLGEKYHSSRTLHQTPATPRGGNSHVVEGTLVYVSQEGRILGSLIHNGLLLLITGTTNPQYKTVLVQLSGAFENKISEFIAVLY